VLFTWASELGLGVLEAMGITPHSKKNWSDLSARFGRALTLRPDEVDAPTPEPTPTRRRQTTVRRKG
jgi:hypothetical protein